MTATGLVAEKRCTMCQEIKPLEDFHRSAKGAGGRQSRCKVCTNTVRREYRSRTLDRHRENDRRWYAKNRHKARAYNLSKLYGITVEQFDEMESEQQGVCFLCGRPPKPDVRTNSGRLHVDHDHESDRVRKLLCYDCNNGLGRFQDDPDLLRKAADYIEAHR